MAYCSQCGAPLQEGTKFCPSCGAPAESASVRMAAPQIEYPVEEPKKKRKSIFKRWWFWVLAVIVIAGIVGRSGTRTQAKPTAKQTFPIVTSAPQAKPKAAAAPAVDPTAEPVAEPTPEPQDAVSENEIRPEDFIQKYMNADPPSMVSMMGDYYSILARYTEFAEKIDAFDESELTNAELAYYLEVTNRVSQKLLRVAG